MNVGEDTTLGNGDVTQELVQFLIVANGQLQMTRDDTGLLVVTSGVASQLENLSSQVFENGGEIDGSTGTNTLGVVTLAQQTVDTADGEGETGLGRAAGGVSLAVVVDVTTYDCAFLLPLALPPDLPPVIVIDGLRGWVGERRSGEW